MVEGAGVGMVWLLPLLQQFPRPSDILIPKILNLVRTLSAFLSNFFRAALLTVKKYIKINPTTTNVNPITIPAIAPPLRTPVSSLPVPPTEVMNTLTYISIKIITA